jgi:hypothetical protein
LAALTGIEPVFTGFSWFLQVTETAIAGTAVFAGISGRCTKYGRGPSRRVNPSFQAADRTSTVIAHSLLQKKPKSDYGENIPAESAVATSTYYA